MTLNSTSAVIGQQGKDHENSELFTLIPLAAARDSDINSGKLANQSARGVVIVVKAANEAGVAGFTPVVRIFDEDGNAIVFWSGAAITANGTFTYVLYPGGMAGAGAGVTAQASIVLPRVWDFLLDYTTGVPGTDKFDLEAYAMYLR